MSSQVPEHSGEHAETYDDRWASTIALLGAVLVGVGVIALFMFITWLTYATD